MITTSLFFACNNSNKNEQNKQAEDNYVNTKLTNKNNASSDLVTFCKNVQQAVAKNDKAAFLNLCSDDVKGYLGEHYESFINNRMKTEIAKATVSGIKDMDGRKLFVYEIVQFRDKQTGETFSSTFGF